MMNTVLQIAKQNEEIELLNELLSSMNWEESKRYRDAFAFLLGFYAHSARSSDKQDCRLERVIESEDARKKVRQAIRVFDPRKINIKRRKIRVQCSKLVNSLDCGLFSEVAFYHRVWSPPPTN